MPKPFSKKQSKGRGKPRDKKRGRFKPKPAAKPQKPQKQPQQEQKRAPPPPKKRARDDDGGEAAAAAAAAASEAPALKRRAAQTSERVSALRGLDKVKHDACVAMDAALKARNPTRRAELVEAVAAAVRGNLAALVLKHDAARVAQMLLKHGSKAHREEALAELEPHIVEMAKGTYSSFVVTKLAQYASKDRVIAALRGHARELLKNSRGWYVIEDIFALRAGAAERRAIVAEFAGGEIAAFAREPGAKSTIAAALEGAPEIKRAAVLGRMKDAVLSLASRGHAADSTLFSNVVLALLSIAPQPVVEEVATALAEQLARMTHTREGARVAVRCVLAAGAKSRKAMIKSLHGHVVDACRDQWGHLFVVALLERTDDTALTGTALVSPIVSEPEAEDGSGGLAGLAMDKFASIPLLAVLSPRNPRYFGPKIRELLGAPDAAPSSKKSAADRRAELLATMSPKLLAACTAHAEQLLCSPFGSRVIVEAASACIGDKAPLRAAIVDTVAGKEGEEAGHVTADPVGNRTLQRLLHGDSELAAAIAERMGDDGMRALALAEDGKPAFVIAAVLANAEPSLRAALSKKLGTAKLRKQLAASTTAGHKLLLDVLDGKPTRDTATTAEDDEDAEGDEQ